MTEQLPTLSDNYLEGIERDFEKNSAVVTNVMHGYDGISQVVFEFKGIPYYTLLDTNRLDFDEAERFCRDISKWWSPSFAQIYELPTRE